MSKRILGSLLVAGLLASALSAADVTLEDKITSLYVSYFDRAPDYDGLSYWERHGEEYISAGKSEYDALKELSAGFASVPTFTDMYSSMSNEDFVKAFYRNVLGKEGDASGVAYWTGKLDNGESRSDMVVEYMDIVLSFDPANYPNLSQAELDAATEAQTVILNKIAVAEAFVDTLKTATNVTDVQHPENDPAYLASLKVLEGVNADQASVDEAIGKIYALRNTPTEAIAMIENGWDSITPDYSFKDTTPSTDFLTPIVPYTQESSSAYAGKIMTYKLGADGEFKASSLLSYPVLELADGLSTLTITQLISESSFQGDFGVEGTASGTAISDFAAGTEHIMINSSKYGTVDCVNKFQSPLPLTVTSDDVEIPNSFEDRTLISTTCPAWVNEEEDILPNNFEEVQNQTVTSASNTVSHISIYLGIQ